MPEILELDAIRSQIDVPAMIQAIEHGFVLYSENKVVVPPVGFLHFEQPPGDVQIEYGYIKNDDVYVLKIASGFYVRDCRRRRNPGIQPAIGSPQAGPRRARQREAEGV